MYVLIFISFVPYKISILLANYIPQACLNTSRSSLSEKRVKREPAAVILREALMKGKWLW